MKRTILLSAVSAILLGAAVMSVSASDCKGFLPPNDLKIPVGSADDKGILEAQFNEVLNTVEKIYKPQVAALGKTLDVRRLWADATVNASAMQSGNRYIINMYGGLARHETITMDGFALVACHEMGHHLGGAPKVSSWASNEGQSDYYANMKCLKQVFADSSSLSFTRLSGSDEVAEKSCNAMYASPQDRAVCVRAAMAGKSVAYLFQILRKETVIPRFDTPSPVVVTSMMSKHPPTQCRMDTYLAGSLCTQPVSAPLSPTDPTVGTCIRSAGFQAGFRPLCWYKPAKPSEFLPSAGRDFGPGEDLAIPGPAFNMLNTAYPWDSLRAPIGR